MSDDLLSRASRSLRDAGEPSEEDLRRLRARVLESVRAQRRRRTRAWVVAFPIAAVLIGTTAWAASTGRLSRLLLRMRGQPTEPAPMPSAAPPKAPVDGHPRPAEPETTTVAPSASSPPPAPPPTVSATVPSIAPVAPAVSSASAAASASASSEPRDLAQYKKAHKLHFVAQDHAAALVAWDEYLAEWPTGSFAAEARYNRAICLVKLGRKAEAKAALAPFAEGKVAGGYRQAEARALIEALDAKP